MNTETKSGSPFWRFSLEFYRQPGVAEACIALQEESGVDVNLLLFLLWHAAQGRQLAVAEVAALEQKIGSWREAAVIPLRAIRRTLKMPPALVEAGAAEVFRNRIKAVELEAERLQQEAMYALVRDGLFGAEAAVAQAARANVAAYAQLCGRPFAQGPVAAVLAAVTERRSTGE